MSFFGPIVPSICQSCACGWGGFFQIIQNLLSLGVTLSVFFAVIIFAYAGFLFVTNPANPGNLESGKKAIQNAIIGLVIVLGAWLIVNTIMNALYNGSFGPWNSIISGTSASCLSFSPPPAATANNSLAAAAGCPGSLICGTGGTCQVDTQLDNGSGGAGQPCIQGSDNCGSGLSCDNTDTCSAAGSATVAIPASCSNAPLTTGSGSGVCDPGTVQSAAAAGGYNISTSEATTLACLAGPESTCGTQVTGAKTAAGTPTSATGPWQTLLGDPSNSALGQCHHLSIPACGNLNCSSAYSGGAIVNQSLATQCQNELANLSCSAADAACIVQAQGVQAGWGSSNSAIDGLSHSKQDQCIINNGG